MKGEIKYFMNIAVYCGSSTGLDPAFQEQATALGTGIAQSGHSLVYGGGNAGLMGVVAKAAFENGGHVTGVLPGNIGFIVSRPQYWCTEVLTEADLTARKQKMLELADVCIALPGGIGTLDEITEVMTLINTGKIDKPAILLNVNGYYEPFREMLLQSVRAGFMKQEAFERYHFFDDCQQLFTFLETL